LEKIEIKKTLVAVAAMAAVTGAMADVTISGFVDKGLNMTTLNNAVQKLQIVQLAPMPSDKIRSLLLPVKT